MENLTIAEDYTFFNKRKIVYKWKIEEFLGLLHTYTYSKNDEIFRSNFFPNNFNWNLQLKFNNIESENKKWITINTKYDVRTEIRFKCSLYILDNKNEKQFIQKFNTVIKDRQEYCIPKFLEITELLENKQKFLPNNELTVGIELTEFLETEKIITVPMKTSRHQLTIDLKDVLESKAGSDVVLLVGDKKILAHKVILTIRSPVFAAMFSHQLKENKENEITIPDMDPEVCEKLLEYIYTENVTGLDEVVELLYEEADKYQLPALKELCEESFCRNVKIENSVKYLVLLDRHHADEKFFDYVLKFIALNSKTIMETADYKELEKKNSGLILTIVRMICSIK
ncbi:speckle-type POZ protein B-like [Cotesia glomerata]|uniref:speckle-type POZ protein B-like n=1 Tax=Cotesia glomerata TaxID=32391 RepID=UPI001D02F0F6|nr:speckle-type POZ protein B-like [Cotesia glomerata]